MLIVDVYEVLQCEDVTLVKFKCPFCYSDSLSGINLSCECCKEDFGSFALNVENSKYRNVAVRVMGRPRKHISIAKIRNLMSIQEGQCAYCYCDITGKYEVEHIKPISAGGSNDYNNLVLSCSDCNKKASSFWFTSFGSKQEFILNARGIKV